MTQPGFAQRIFLRILSILIIGLIPRFSIAQQTKISDYVIFGGSGSCTTCAVNIGSSTSINGRVGWKL